MKVYPLLAAVALLISTVSLAQSAPRIVVAISVDQLSADLFAEYRPLFKAGIARLQTGAVFSGAYQSHGATETCPGHSTLLTGVHPARTGIIANEWYEQSLSRSEKKSIARRIRPSQAPPPPIRRYRRIF